MKWILLFFMGSTAFAGTRDCNELGLEIREKLSVPYKTFSDTSVKSCLTQTTVNSKNLPLFIASAFYYRNLETRKKALAKLEGYSCEDKISCGDFYQLLDSHIKATTLEQPKSWKDFSTRTNLLRAKAQAQFDELKNAK